MAKLARATPLLTGRAIFCRWKRRNNKIGLSFNSTTYDLPFPRCAFATTSIAITGGKSKQKLAPEILDQFAAVMSLLRYYFIPENERLAVVGDTSILWQRQKLAEQLRVGDENLKRYFFVYLVKHFLPDDKSLFSQMSNPIILFEDPESRLHPRLMSIMWELVNYIPLQRLMTTNSVELLAHVPLHSICRLERGVERIQAYQLDRHDLGKVDIRRLTFHIHYNRCLALFSRVWIFVEGETEVWILNELARILDLNLENEGVRIVEFAQCGIRPLIKYANLMGIEWHMLTDGDDAGHKYAAIATELLRENEHYLDKITLLPRKDIEHYFSIMALIMFLSVWLGCRNIINLINHRLFSVRSKILPNRIWHWRL